MRLIEQDDNQFTFELSDQQKLLFERILKDYPIAQNSHHSISKSSETVELPDQQQLLEEALAENRAEMKRKVGNFLRDPRRFEETEQGWRVSILARQVDWLLQVLNEIRISSWHRLNCPEHEDLELLREDPESFLRMKLCGQFQTVLLWALDGNVVPDEFDHREEPDETEGPVE